MPRFLTHRNWALVSRCCFRPLSLWYFLVGLNSTDWDFQTADIYLPLSGNWESKTTAAADSVPGGMASCCVLRGRGGKGTLQDLFYKDNNAPS